MELTDKQKQIQDFIRKKTLKQGFPPTRREIQEHFGFASPNAVQTHLKALVRKGAIKVFKGIARGIVLR